MLMRELYLPLAAALVVAGCLVGCGKPQPATEETVLEPIENALTIQTAGETQAFVYPIGSVFQLGSIYLNPNVGGEPGAGLSYKFFRDTYTDYPKGGESPIVEISGIQYTSVVYAEPWHWISSIVIYGLDESLNLGSYLTVPIAEGKYEGGNSLVQDARINSFQNRDFNIVITTTTGAVITILYSGKVLHDDNLI